MDPVVYSQSSRDVTRYSLVEIYEDGSSRFFRNVGTKTHGITSQKVVLLYSFFFTTAKANHCVLTIADT